MVANKTKMPNASTRAAVRSVDDYIARQPKEQQRRLQTIRTIAHVMIPEAEEAISYAIPTIRSTGKNVAHFGGYGDHVSIYPVPESLASDLQEYVRGKGTLWFDMTRPLPEDVVENVLHALAKERLNL